MAVVDKVTRFNITFHEKVIEPGSVLLKFVDVGLCEIQATSIKCPEVAIEHSAGKAVIKTISE